jgi:cell division protein FtsL
MRQPYEPRWELHQILNTVFAALLVATASFLYSVNNQLILTNEKITVISRNLDNIDNRVSKNEERLRLIEIHKK